MSTTSFRFLKNPTQNQLKELKINVIKFSPDFPIGMVNMLANKQIILTLILQCFIAIQAIHVT
jgi:hypothetical protein